MLRRRSIFFFLEFSKRLVSCLSLFLPFWTHKHRPAMPLCCIVSFPLHFFPRYSTLQRCRLVCFYLGFFALSKGWDLKHCWKRAPAFSFGWAMSQVARGKASSSSCEWGISRMSESCHTLMIYMSHISRMNQSVIYV